MSARKSERLMNLVIALLVTPSYLSKERIRHVVEGYRDQTEEAFDRMFERDKDELREIGVNIEVGAHQKAFGDERGYRIVRGDFELPEIALEPDEAAVLGLAARVWQHARLADQTSSALMKLKASGIGVDPEPLAMIEPQLAASEPAFDPLWDAVVSRTPVSFTYQRPGQEPTCREVEPWSVMSWHGRWYLAGLDRGRSEPRLFRLSRIAGEVASSGSPREYDIPDDTDIKAMATALFPAPATEAATLRVHTQTAYGLRRRATQEASLDESWDELRVPYGSVWELASEIASYGPDVQVVEPADLRVRVVQQLRRLAEPYEQAGESA